MTGYFENKSASNSEADPKLFALIMKYIFSNGVGIALFIKYIDNKNDFCILRWLGYNINTIINSK